MREEPAQGRTAADLGPITSMSFGEPSTRPPLARRETAESELVDVSDLNRRLEEAMAEVRAAQNRVRLLRAELRLRSSKNVIAAGSLIQTIGVGALAGVGAGIIFALFHMIMSQILGNGFLEPLRLIAAIALGPSVLPQNSPLLDPLFVGLLVHVSLAALYGAVFAVSARYIRILRRDLITATTLFGLGIWLVNFYFFSPLFFPWFGHTLDIVQFISHTLFYGMPLGAILLEFSPSGGVMSGNRAQQTRLAGFARRVDDQDARALPAHTPALRSGPGGPWEGTPDDGLEDARRITHPW